MQFGWDSGLGLLAQHILPIRISCCRMSPECATQLIDAPRNRIFRSRLRDREPLPQRVIQQTHYLFLPVLRVATHVIMMQESRILRN